MDLKVPKLKFWRDRHTWARSNPKGNWGWGGEGGIPTDKISTMIRKDISRRTRSFSQNSDHFARTNTYKQMRGRDFSGGRPGHLNAITHPPPRGVLGAAAPRMAAKLKFLKRFEVLENDCIFQKYQHFSCQRNRLFSKKKFEIWNRFYKNFLNFFRK